MGSKMRIVVVGLPLFAERLVEKLKRFSPANKFIFLNTYYSKLDQLKALYEIPRADLIFSINGSLNSSKVFDLALKHNIPLVMNWVGTDVLLATEAVSKNNFIDNYRTKAIHFCEVKWIKEELSKIGIEAQIQNFAAFPKKFEIKNFATDSLNVLTYVNDNRQDFYGIQEILKLANHFPQIHFYIVGTKAEDYTPLPSNVTALGWIENMSDYFDLCQVTIRFPEHDGLATFVLESLAKGKLVLYKYDFSHCIHTPTYDSMVEKLTLINDSFNQKTLSPNIAGVEFIKNEFSEDAIFNSLLNKLESLVSKKNG
jgi:hypothetical protein